MILNRATKKALQLIVFLTLPVWFVPAVLFMFLAEVWGNIGRWIDGKEY